MIDNSKPITYKYILLFWYPLALTWAMMALEGPVLQAFVSWLPMQKENLAAYGLATNIAMIIESPVIMILSATVALVNNRSSFEKLKRFSNALNILVTVVYLIPLLPPVFNWLAFSVLSLTPEIAALLYKGLLCLVLWSASIGYRRFYQGLMIKRGQTRLVAIGTIARLVTMALSAIVLSYFPIDGVIVGAGALGAGVLFEAIATRIMANDVVRYFRQAESSHTPLTLRSVVSFYIPLALTSVVGMAINPLMAFFMGRFLNPIESLAVFPVIDSFVFQFRSAGFSYQEVGIALLGEHNRNERKIRNVGIGLMAVTTILLVGFAFTPLLHIVYTVFPYHLTPALSWFAILPTQILVLLPILSVLYSLQRSLLINSRLTKQVTVSTIIEISVIGLMLLLMASMFTITGITAVSIALITGKCIANVYLYWYYRLELQKNRNYTIIQA
ncbi:MAG: hypothetical protein K1X91_05445 [Bacteriodetes bacterium]|nr:hypothetical protein [Bacteroidota bacterium]